MSRSGTICVELVRCEGQAGHSPVREIAISIPVSDYAIAPCCDFWHVWAFALTRSSGWNSATSTGVEAIYVCGVREAVNSSCRCLPR